MTLSTPGFQTASLRNCEEINFCCLKSPGPKKLGQHCGQENGIRRLAGPWACFRHMGPFPSNNSSYEDENAESQRRVREHLPEKGTEGCKGKDYSVHASLECPVTGPQHFLAEVLMESPNCPSSFPPLPFVTHFTLDAR